MMGNEAKNAGPQPSAGPSGGGPALRPVALPLMAVLITVAFLGMVQSFLMALALAAISAVMFAPLYNRVLAKMPKKPEVASALTLVVVVLCTLGPLIGVVALASSQAAELGSEALALLSHQPAALNLADLPDWVPFRDKILHSGPQIAEKAGEIASSVAGFIATSLTELTRGTAVFFLELFVYLYALYIFLPFKISVLRQVMAHTGLTPDIQVLLSDRIVAISRATIRGTLLIGMVQGALGGLGFWAAGIDGAAFWAVVITVASVIPAVGGAFVVFGGAIYLGIEGDTATAIALGLWGGLVVGSIDNVLRPMLVGREAQMNDILILIGTLGGLSAFGAAGLVLGPVLAGLFVAIWDAMAAAASGDAPEAAAPDAPPPPTPDPPDPSDPPDRLEAELDDMRRQLSDTPTEDR